MAWPLIMTKKPTRIQRTMRSAATWASTDNQRNWSPPIEITKPKALPTNTSNAPVSIRRTPRTIGWYSAGTPRPRPINAQARAKKTRKVTNATLDGRSLVLDHLELVPVGIEKSKRRAPFLLLHGLRNLDAVLAESRLLLVRVLRREEESGVPLLRTRVRAEVESDVRTPWRD